jgi:hypothetical protein
MPKSSEKKLSYQKSYVKSTERAAQKKYDAENMKTQSFRLNRISDADVIAFWAAVEDDKAKLFREMTRQYMSNCTNNS